MPKRPKVSKDPQLKAVHGFGARYFDAVLDFARRLGRMPTQSEVGRLVAERLGKSPFRQATVSRWRSGAQPDLETTAAIALALGCDPGWLGFGELSQAPPPPGVAALRVAPPPDLGTV